MEDENMRNNSSKGTQRINKKEVKGMNKILIGTIVGMLLLTGLAFALDESNPYSIVLKWIIPSDTTFTVSIRGDTPTIDFTPASKSENMVEPDNQVAASSLPILNVTNSGNTALDLWHNATSPSWADVYAGVTNDYYASTMINETAMIQFKDELAIGSHQDVYMWSNITNAAAGTVEKTYAINATTD